MTTEITTIKYNEWGSRREIPGYGPVGSLRIRPATIHVRPGYKRLVQRWLKALRSGTWQQGKGSLHAIHPNTGAHRYCCWGVWCEVFRDKIGLDTETNPVSPGQHVTRFVSYFRVQDATDDIPSSYAKWFGMPSMGWMREVFLSRDWGTGSLRGDGIVDFASVLASMNDTGSTFTEIADYIEAVVLEGYPLWFYSTEDEQHVWRAGYRIEREA